MHTQHISFGFILLILVFGVCKALDCASPTKTITVKQSGQGNFKTIQRAIDSVPSHNTQWIHIQISPGIYKEKITISLDKPCICFEGGGMKYTIIEWHDNITSTFSSWTSNIITKGITFKNMYNHPDKDEGNNITRAVAASINGDKCAFLHCAFFGVQDTLMDFNGRHYFHGCYIQGSVDFIFGNGQSIYEKCIISHTIGRSGVKFTGGFITAQSRESPNDPSGFVFNNCSIIGSSGKAYLGRAWRGYSRVIIANSVIADMIEPEGWNAWNYRGQEAKLTYVEEGCSGPGANKSRRVPWLKHMSRSELSHFLSHSYIDQEGWIAKLPIRISM